MEKYSIKDTIHRNEKLANSGISFIGTVRNLYLVGKKVLMKVASMPGGQEAYDLVAVKEICKSAWRWENHVWLTSVPDGAERSLRENEILGSKYTRILSLIAKLWPPCNTCLDFLQKTCFKSSLGGTRVEWTALLDQEITADVLKCKDDEGQDGPIVNYILDAAEQRNW